MKLKSVNGIVKLTGALVMLAALLQGCLDMGMPKKPTKDTKVIYPLKLAADSGYVFKKDLLVFLQMNDLADTLNTWWKQWKITDTLGKYYKTEDGGYLVCVVASDEKGNVESNKLIQVDKNGVYKESQDFFCDWCNINRRTAALQKRGSYFVTYTCGHGASFSSSWLCLFRKLSERSEANQLLEAQYEGAPFCSDITSAWRITGDSCIVVYDIEKGMPTDSGCEMQPSQKLVVVYRRTNNLWAATDSSKLKQLHLEK
jgi:hypothetical protein